MSSSQSARSLFRNSGLETVFRPFPIHSVPLGPTSPESGTDMTGRPGYRTMEMIGGSSAPYLACTPCVPLFCTSFNRGGNRSAFRLPGAGGGSFPLYGGTFARSYSVSTEDSLVSFFWDFGPKGLE